MENIRKSRIKTLGTKESVCMKRLMNVDEIGWN